MAEYDVLQIGLLEKLFNVFSVFYSGKPNLKNVRSVAKFLDERFYFQSIRGYKDHNSDGLMLLLKSADVHHDTLSYSNLRQVLSFYGDIDLFYGCPEPGKDIFDSYEDGKIKLFRAKEKHNMAMESLEDVKKESSENKDASLVDLYKQKIRLIKSHIDRFGQEVNSIKQSKTRFEVEYFNSVIDDIIAKTNCVPSAMFYRNPESAVLELNARERSFILFE